MSYKKIQREFAKILNEIRIHNKFLNISEQCDNHYNQKLWATCLYLSILDLTENIVIILHSKKPISCPPLVRNCIDAYINLLNVIEKYDFFIRHEKKELIKTIEKFNALS